MLTFLVVLAVLLVAGLAAWVVLRPHSADDGANGPAGLSPEAYEILSLSWEELEALLRESFERQNFRVFERAPGGTIGPAAGLADMVLERKGKRWFVSAKYWRENPVPGQEIVEVEWVTLFSRSTPFLAGLTLERADPPAVSPSTRRRYTG